MESNKQERSNLLNDNPIASRAGGSWMSKHSIVGGSPLHKEGSPVYNAMKTGTDKFTTHADLAKMPSKDMYNYHMKSHK